MKKRVLIIIGMVLSFISGGSIGVYAANKINSNVVLYSNSKSDVTNVKEALDELMEKMPRKLSKVVNVGDYVAYDVSPAGKGWRVLSADENTNTVTIVYAGGLEDCNHGTDAAASVTNLNNIAQKYKDDTYASSAHAMNKGEVDAIAQSSDLRNIGINYWLASLNDSGTLWYVYSNGAVLHSNGFGIAAVRPVIVLKPNIKTTGKTTDVVGNKAWNLIAP